MNTSALQDTMPRRTSLSFVRNDSTACETGFAVTASRSDSLAELARHVIFVRGFSVEGGAEITDVKPADIVGYR